MVESETDPHVKAGDGAEVNNRQPYYIRAGVAHFNCHMKNYQDL